MAVAYSTVGTGAHKFAPGESIAPKAGVKFAASSLGALLAARRVTGGIRSTGNFLEGHGTGYVGFQFKTAGSKHYYGWLKAKVMFDTHGLPTGESLLANADGIYGAYGLASDDITAGEVAAPEPSSLALEGLGLLALGALGVREMRRRQSRRP